MDYGIKESEFWEMSIDELIRAINSKKRIIKQKAQERANFDYILADLIGRSIGRLYSNQMSLPEISEAYPNLFDSQKTEEAKDELSAQRFKLFANSFNKRIKQEVQKGE